GPVRMMDPTCHPSPVLGDMGTHSTMVRLTIDQYTASESDRVRQYTLKTAAPARCPRDDAMMVWRRVRASAPDAATQARLVNGAPRLGWLVDEGLLFCPACGREAIL